MSQRANLRVCASCEWIFVRGTPPQFPSMPAGGCPKCGFAHYGAHHVYGRNAYRYAETQQPWYDRKMSEYAGRLRAEINASKLPPDATGPFE